MILKSLNKFNNFYFQNFLKLYFIELNKKKINNIDILIIYKLIKKNKEKKKYLIYYNNEFVGFVILTLSKNIIGKKICIINDFYIKKLFRKKKFGSKAVKKILSVYKIKGYKDFRIEILSTNTIAKKFWGNFNFKKKSEIFHFKIK